MDSPRDITVDIVQKILMEHEKDSTIIVLPCLVVEAATKDFHGCSTISRVKVTFTRGENQQPHTLSLIIKLIPNSTLTEVVMKSSMFPREIQMFKEILPRMSAFLSRSTTDQHEDFFAQIYYTQTSPDYLIALEDLALKGFEAPKRKKGLDLKHCQLTLKMLAKFHAASVMIYNKERQLFSVFDEYAFGEEARVEAVMNFATWVGNFVIHTVESWADFGPSWAKRLSARCDTFHEDMPALWKRDDNAFNVLCHGDFGLHNLMFRHSESGDVEAVMFVDFQCCSYNSPALDLQQFLFSSAADDVRANHTDTLLREYHAELTSTLELLGSPKEQIISLQQLLQEFESKALYAFFYVVGIVPGLTYDGQLNYDDFSKLADDGFKKYDFLISEPYTNALKRLLPIFRQKNIL